MVRYLLNRRFVLLLLSVILLFLSVGMTSGDRGELIGPESWVKNGIGWMQGFIYPPTRAVLSLFPTEKEAQNHIATAEILQLKSQVNQLTRENEELKKLIGYETRNEITYIPAQVVFRSPDRWNNRVVLNRGLKDGVLPKMPIITSEGLIGRVQSVTSHMADIQLLTDSGSGPGIAAVIQEGKNETLGIIEGYDSEKKLLIMKKIPASATPKKGQIVVTSRFSDIYSDGILIGTVEQVKIGDFGVDQMVYVKPSATFEQLDVVMVVRDPAKIQLKQLQEEDTKTGTGGEMR